MRFEFPFNLIGDDDKQRPFLTGQSWRVLKSGYTAGSPEQGFRRCFADGVNQSFILSARRLGLPKMTQKQQLHFPLTLIASFDILYLEFQISTKITEITKILNSYSDRLT